jgi:hypothetical protein
MPEYLKAFLSGLTPEQADEVWLWLDGNPDAVGEMIEVVAPIAQPEEVHLFDKIALAQQ